jgi:hypothetical protein
MIVRLFGFADSLSASNPGLNTAVKIAFESPRARQMT